MKKNIFIQSRTIIITLLMIVFSVNFAYSQTGLNFDFAYGTTGNYSFWRGSQATNLSSSSTIIFSPWVAFNSPVFCTWTYGGSTENCFVINSDINAYDSIVGGANLKKIPTGYTRSTRINCPLAGGNANMLTYDILLNDTNCLLTFNYAMVIQDTGHTGYENPFFKIEVQRLIGEQEVGLIDPCATFEVIGDNNSVPPGWGTFGSGYDGGIWQNWRQISMNLTNYISEKVRIKVILAACEPSGNWAYGYFVGRVGPSALTFKSCNGDTVDTITAPSGFQKYEWFRAPSAGMTESQMSYIAATSPVLYADSATAITPANNRFVISNAMFAANGQNYFVKVTSPSSSSTVLGCVAYMTATAQSIKPITGFAYTAHCSLRAIFTNQTTFPVDDVDAIKEYYWDFGDDSTAYYSSYDSLTNGNINPVHQYATPGTYTVRLRAVYNGCDSIVNLNLIVNPTYLTNHYDTICKGQAYNNYGFNFTANTSQLYTQNLQTINGCDSIIQLNLQVIKPPKVELEMVTVDINNHNEVIWNKDEMVNHYNIYKEGNVAGQYDLIATVIFDSVSMFIDTNSNPTVKAYMYKISTTDTCMNESVLSPFHKTMHLTIGQGMGNNWNLNWTPYVGANYSTYNIYRGINSLDSLQFLTTISSSNTSYTDINVPSGYVYYQIEIIIDTTTSDTIILNKAIEINCIRSNYATNDPIGLNDISSSNITTKLYPNPSEGKAKLEINGLKSDADVLVYDMIGRVIQRHKINKGNNELDIDLTGYSKGVYSIRIINNSINQTKKLIVQ